jgi:hypothetical protein
MSKIDDLIGKCTDWSNDRGIIKNGTKESQCLKLVSEVGELADNIAKGRDVWDDIGDCLVVLNNLAVMHDSTLEDCLGFAYEDIKDRKGYLNSSGVFIKEGDKKNDAPHVKNLRFKLAEDSPTLKEAQSHVDGLVEVLTCGGAQVLINEEGMYRNDLPFNLEVTKLAIEAGYMTPEKGIVGNAIILTGKACWQ